VTKSKWILAACLPAILGAAFSILPSCKGESARTGESAPPAESAQPADAMINVGTHRLEMHREGTGEPTIVIDAGITDGIDKLRPLSARLAQATTVVTYNRAGYGRSEPGPFPRDAAREADELRALLHEASVPEPYVLVGHSLGAFNVLIFANLYGEHVAGIVLLDPPPLSFALGREYKELGAMARQMTAQWEAAADSAAKSADPAERAHSAFFRAIASEHREMFGPSAKLVEGIATLGDIPLLVMAAGKANPAFGPIAEEYQKYWIEQSRALGGKSTNAKFVVVPESSHYLYLDAPELVAESILSVVSGARAK
jgi:pimeloyl-ACP methyl ester carboxylesterase